MNTNNPAMNNPITEDDIAHYLSNTPDFFVRHAELLAAVQFTSPHSNRTVGLQERQAEMLREKIKALEHRIMEMIRHGSENVMLSDKVLRWARTLLTVRAAMLLAVPSLLPCLRSLSRMCWYWRSRLLLHCFCGMEKAPLLVVKV